MGNAKFIKDGKEMVDDEYESFEAMVSECDYMVTEETQDRAAILNRYRDLLTDEELEMLNKK